MLPAIGVAFAKEILSLSQQVKDTWKLSLKDPHTPYEYCELSIQPLDLIEMETIIKNNQIHLFKKL